MTMSVIDTERLLLRPFTDNDAGEMFKTGLGTKEYQDIAAGIHMAAFRKQKNY